MRKEVLLLNSSWQPMRVISWRKAITLYYRGVVEIVENYTDSFLRTPSMNVPVPCVVRFIKYNRRSFKEARFTRRNVYLRDNGRCRYCSKEIGFQDITLDHVHPKSKGGGSDWDNVVISCHTCNQKKGSKTLSEAGMEIKGGRPTRPTSSLPIPQFMALEGRYPEQWAVFLT
jgi:5-methylcytosine-specific restriction endonuclease McrA